MYEEDAISLGDDEPITHEPFADDEFDEIDAMVLDRYNATSMAMDAEASLFRQVPSARCHAPNRFGTVNMEDNVNIKRS